MSASPPPALLEIRRQLQELRRQLLAFEQERAALIAAVAAPYRASARNLLHFAAFHRRNHHLPSCHLPNNRSLDEALRQQGLSTLAGCDPHLLASLNTLIAVVERLCGNPAGFSSAANGHGAQTPSWPEPPISHAEAHGLLRRHCENLLGNGGAVMVTLPAAALDDPGLIPELLSAGMDVARIPCAHHTPADWEALAGQVRAAAQAQGRACRIAIELAGPRLRTGPLPPLPGVVAARPERDRYGRLVQPVRILALPEGGAPPPDSDPRLVVLPVVGESWRQLDSGDRLRSRDASGRWRELVVDRRLDHGVVLYSRQHCRFIAGLVFRQEGGPVRLEVAVLPECPGELLLQRGDRLRLCAGPISQEAAAGLGPARMSCSLPEVLGALEPGQRVLFDDGRIGAVVVAPAVAGECAGMEVELEIMRARPKGSRLRTGRGINLPDTHLRLPALTARDREELAVACRHGDLLICSFLRNETDIACLQQALAEQDSPCRGLVLKIETHQAFLNLPRLLLAAMAEPIPLGVMIARADLAVECGWEALSAIQEEILRVCAAAHVPCIRATEVPETMAGRGSARTHHSVDPSTEQADQLLSCLCF